MGCRRTLPGGLDSTGASVAALPPMTAADLVLGTVAFVAGGGAHYVLDRWLQQGRERVLQGLTGVSRYELQAQALERKAARIGLAWHREYSWEDDARKLLALADTMRIRGQPPRT